MTSACVNCLKSLVTALHFLCWFYVLLSFLISVELAMACVFFVYNREIGTYFEKDLMYSLEIYKLSGPGENQTLKDDFDAVQYLFKCCGVHGVADWGGHVPISCCTLDPCNIADQPNWQEGCVGKLQDWFARNYLSTAAGVVSMFILQFLCMSITLPLFCCFAVHGQGY
ncbi:leukocyte surface antigen CD53 isoform X3 [Oreochromis niloticus]|uniref:leukocyte surface antigen CD53 isoform X3 n=1 Tax=Oreochromis niloticus TaxID=8128 RepID=UPI000904FBC4|nr:leukocyte surface antigen CD53 isoform X3 [Oreochromis niloticus]